MKKQTFVISVIAFLVITFLPVPQVLASSHNDVDLAELFNLHTNPSGLPHCGYIFRLAEYAEVILEGHDNIDVVSASVNLFYAPSFEDILNFVSYELIIAMQHNSIIPPATTVPVFNELSLFAPHAYAPTHVDRFREQWHLDFIRGQVAWTVQPPISTRGIVVAVIDSGLDLEHPAIRGLNVDEERAWDFIFSSGNMIDPDSTIEWCN